MSQSFIDPLPLKIYPSLLLPLVIPLAIFILSLTPIYTSKNAMAMPRNRSFFNYNLGFSPSLLITISLLSFHVSCVASEKNEANSTRRK